MNVPLNTLTDPGSMANIEETDNVDDHVDGFTGSLPGFKATLQEPFDLIEANPCQAHDAFFFFPLFGQH